MREREKGKTIFSFTWLFFGYTIKEWAYKVVKINGVEGAIYIVEGQVPSQIQMPTL